MKELFIAAVLATSLGIPCMAQQSLFGRDLLFNGNAEGGTGSPSCGPVTTPGWATTDNFTVGTYGGRNDVLGPNSPGPSERGKNFFCGGNSPKSSAKQSIDVSSAASTIDAGNVKFVLSGWLGGFETNDDNPTLLVAFKDQNQTILGQSQIGPIKAADRSNATGLLFKQLSAQIPPGTRTVAITLNMERASGTLDDAYADNLSFVMLDPNQPNAGLSTGISTSGSGIATIGTSGGAFATNLGKFIGGLASASSNPVAAISSGLPLVSNIGSFGSGTSSGNIVGSGGFPSGSNSSNFGNSGSFASSSNSGNFANSGSGLTTTLLGGNSANSGGLTTALIAGNFGNSGGLTTGSSAISGVVHDRGKTIVTLDSDLIFDRSKWLLLPNAEQVLDQLRQSEFVNRRERPAVFEGHTDEMADDNDNITVSAMRAISIVDWMVKHGVSSAQFEVRGSGKSMPKMVNINGLSRSQNRRVEIILSD